MEVEIENVWELCCKEVCLRDFLCSINCCELSVNTIDSALPYFSSDPSDVSHIPVLGGAPKHRGDTARPWSASSHRKVGSLSPCSLSLSISSPYLFPLSPSRDRFPGCSPLYQLLFVYLFVCVALLMINKIITRLLRKFGKMFAPFSMEGTCAISLQKKRAIPACNDAGQFGESLIFCV